MGKIKIMVIGNGGREDALIWKISQSPLVSQVFCAPGNAGISVRPKTKCLPNLKATDIQNLKKFALENKIDLTVVGPEVPLVAGIVDEFEKENLKIFGPKKEAAQIEGSKVFAKNFLKKYKIPTPSFAVFGIKEIAEAKKYAKENLPCVIKADGLAGGKGVIPCFNENEVLAAIGKIMVKKEFGESGNRVVIEEFLKGEEATFKVLTDGEKTIPLLSIQDHKPVFDGDRGPNTGGMGAYAPAPVVTKELERQIMETIINPTLGGMEEEGKPYKGVLYVGLMITSQGPKVLEFNCRFGDPELQPIVLLMKSDILPILMAVSQGQLTKEKINWEDGAAVCVVMTSAGYPGEYQTGREIRGLDKVAKTEDVVVFHAGTREENGKILTAGGRVLGVTARAQGIPEAIRISYRAVSKISWDGEHHRTDIGQRALSRRDKSILHPPKL